MIKILFILASGVILILAGCENSSISREFEGDSVIGVWGLSSSPSPLQEKLSAIDCQGDTRCKIYSDYQSFVLTEQVGTRSVEVRNAPERVDAVPNTEFLIKISMLLKDKVEVDVRFKTDMGRWNQKWKNDGLPLLWSLYGFEFSEDGMSEFLDQYPRFVSATISEGSQNVVWSGFGTTNTFNTVSFSDLKVQRFKPLEIKSDRYYVFRVVIEPAFFSQEVAHRDNNDLNLTGRQTLITLFVDAKRLGAEQKEINISVP